MERLCFLIVAAAVAFYCGFQFYTAIENHLARAGRQIETAHEAKP